MFTTNIIVMQVIELLQLSVMVALLPVCHKQLCLRDAYHYVTWKDRFRTVLWGREMLDLLANFAKRNRRHAYWLIGRMEDWLNELPSRNR